MSKITAISLSKASVLEKAFSIERLKATQNSELGILNMFVRLVKEEGVRGFSASDVKIGGKDDNYYLLYYYNGIRYKVFKDGQCAISSADSDRRFDAQEKELAAIVETAMANEISRLLALELSEDNSISVGKPKRVNVDDFGCSPTIVMGVMRG